MDSERLGLTREQQAQVDMVFLDTTLQALAQQKHYWERAAMVSLGDVANELEGIHARAFDQAHTALLEDRVISPDITTIIGKLAFIDSLALPSSQAVGRKDKVERALGDFANRRRLFSNLLHAGT